MDAGYLRDQTQEDPNEVRMYIHRYTKEQGREMYEQLNEKEKQIVREFTAQKEEAVDFFNREMIKEKYKVEGEIEGWIHRFWDDGSYGMGTQKNLKDKGYVEDMQKSLYKALVELENAEVFNTWMREFFPTVSKPLAP